MQTNEVILLIVRIVVLLLALWPYVCLAYLSDIRKITTELKGIKAELRKLSKEEKEKEEDKQCEDTSTESIG